MVFSSVAILIDGDNVSSAHAGQILRKIPDLGPHRMRLAYCNSSTIKDWGSAPSFRTVLASSKKNGADILLSIDAVKFALRDNIEAFVIASNDGDLAAVAHTLRELGRHVVGMGEENAAKELKFACTQFVSISPPQAKIETSELGEIDKALRRILETQDPRSNGILVSKINALVRNEVHAIKISEQPEKTWPKYLAKRPELYTVSGDGKEKTVRIAAANDEN